MPAGITLKVKEDFILRQLYIKQYKEQILKIRNDETKRDVLGQELKNLRKNFVKSYVSLGEDISAYELKTLVDAVFYEFDWKKIDLPALLTAREEILDIIKETNLSPQTMEFVEKAFGSTEGLKNGELSYFDALLVSKIRTRRKMVDNVKFMYEMFDDCLLSEPLQKLYNEDLKGSIVLSGNGRDARNYWYKLCQVASTYKEEAGDIFEIGKVLGNTTETEIAMLPSSKSPGKKERLYLEMEYYEESSRTRTTHYYDAPSRTTRTRSTRISALNPQYVKDNLPKGVELLKDKKGYYLIQRAQEISKKDLTRIGRRYNREATLSELNRDK